MRTYGQYCAAAKALDLVGDRWTLLIVRELLVRGPARYTDLQAGLPGIATNLLADRLKELEAAGLIRREPAQPASGAVLLQLTERGAALEPVVHALGTWGAPLLARPVKGDAFRAHWLALPAALHLKDHAPTMPAVAIEVRAKGEIAHIEAAEGRVRMKPGPVAAPAAVLSGTPQLIVGVLTGGMTLVEATAWGLEIEGDPKALLRVQPKAGRPEDWALQRQLFPG